MSMRITNSSMTDRTLAEIQRSYKQLATTQESIASGYRVNRPSDDPLAAGQAALRSGELAGIKSAKDSAAAATTWLTAADTSLEAVNNILKRAKELTVGGANGTMSQQNRDANAAEIDQLIESAKDAINAKSSEQFLFAGTATDTPPYAKGTGDAYQGDDNAVLRTLGAGTVLQVNPQLVPLNASPAGTTLPLNGRAILGDGGSMTGSPATGDGRVLSTLRDIAAHLRGGSAADLVALQTTDQAALNANVNLVSNGRSAIGAAQNRTDAATERLDSLEEVGTKALTDLTSTDLAKAMTDMNAQQVAFQAALKSGAQIIQQSLLDFLR